MITPEHAVRPTTSSKFKSIIAKTQDFIRKIIGGDRLQNLTKSLHLEINEIALIINKKPKVLDYGCGNMEVAKFLTSNNIVEEIACIDIYPKPNNLDVNEWKNYQQVTSKVLPFDDKSFDLVIIVDVLHHAGIENAISILEEASRCSNFIIVKEHLEHGFISRHLLRLADWYGNWAYGVNVPDHYFSRTTWAEIVKRANLEELKFINPVRIHKGLFGFIIPPSYHFISLLKSS